MHVISNPRDLALEFDVMSMQTFALKFLVCNIVWREIIVGQDFHQFPSHHKKFSHENFDCENLTTCTTHMGLS